MLGAFALMKTAEADTSMIKGCTLLLLAGLIVIQQDQILLLITVNNHPFIAYDHDRLLKLT